MDNNARLRNRRANLPYDLNVRSQRILKISPRLLSGIAEAAHPETSGD